MSLADPRSALKNLFSQAVAAVGGRRRVAAALRARPMAGPFYLVAIGKAASAMAEGVLEVDSAGLVRALVITKPGHGSARLDADDRFATHFGGHPVPDAGSLAAGQALLEFLAAIPVPGQVLFCLSGGTSSLVEVLPQGWALEDLRELNRALLASGLDIAAMNTLRRRASLIKGGGLLAFLHGHSLRQLLISDVPDDDPRVIGSGLLTPSVARDAAGELDAVTVPKELAGWLTRLRALHRPDADRTAAPPAEIVASLSDARQAAARAGRTLGIVVHLEEAFVAGDAARAGRDLPTRMRAPGLWIWGGETTVRLPPHPGLGGRNQHLALACALEIQGSHDRWFLAAGTDGTDGPTEYAGGIVDGGTVARGRAAGLGPEDCLARADSGRFLAASGDLLDSGPTGTNVMDLMLGLRV